MFGGAYFAGALFAGVVGAIGPLPAAPTNAGIVIGGIEVTARVRVQGVTIRDVLNDAPNTATLTIEGEAPAVGQSIRITAGARLLFTGSIQTIDQAYESLPTHVAWHLTAIDDTGYANARRPFGTFNTSASFIAQSISGTFAPNFSQAGIQPGLPLVQIVFDGADTFIACLARLATAVGGYCKIEDRTVYLFTVDPTDPPNPIDVNHRFLTNPPITLNTDASQLRTRVYGKGYGEQVPTDVGASETLLPIQDGAQFPAFGGTAIVGFNADAAQSDRIAFTGVSRPVGGTLVGSGATPANAPTLGLAAGGVCTTGVHQVAVVYVTGSGKSLAGPSGSINVNPIAAPGAAPTANTPTPGAGPSQGSYDYAVTFVILGGETTIGTPSNVVSVPGTVGQLPTPTAAPYVDNSLVLPGAGIEPNILFYSVTFTDAQGETLIGPDSNGIQTTASNGQVQVTQIPIGPAGTTGRKLYRGVQGFSRKVLTTIGNNTTTTYLDTTPTASLTGAIPPANTTGTAVQQVPITQIPIGPAGTTARKLYRRYGASAGFPFNLVTTIANNTTTTFTDTVVSAGAQPPTTSTATGNTISVSSIPTGTSAVTARELYMTTAGNSALHLAQTIADNTTTTATLNIADASLTGAAPPATDTSGLQQPQGQINPGSPTLIVASPAPFASSGGWVTTGGGQVLRYTGISGQLLTGIPASGPGAIVTTILYGQQATPTPTLTGVTGMGKLMLKGSAVHLWVQRDDTLAQAEHAARTGTDGIVEFLIVDGRRAMDSLVARCDADLKLFSRPILTVQYATRDIKTASGKTVAINLASPPIVATMIIQEVTITEIDIAPHLPPRFTVKASTVRFSLEDTLRRLIAGGLTSVND